MSQRGFPLGNINPNISKNVISNDNVINRHTNSVQESSHVNVYDVSLHDLNSSDFCDSFSD